MSGSFLKSGSTTAFARGGGGPSITKRLGVSGVDYMHQSRRSMVKPPKSQPPERLNLGMVVGRRHNMPVSSKKRKDTVMDAETRKMILSTVMSSKELQSFSQTGDEDDSGDLQFSLTRPSSMGGYVKPKQRKLKDPTEHLMEERKALFKRVAGEEKKVIDLKSEIKVYEGKIKDQRALKRSTMRKLRMSDTELRLPAAQKATHQLRSLEKSDERVEGMLSKLDDVLGENMKLKDMVNDRRQEEIAHRVKFDSMERELVELRSTIEYRRSQINEVYQERDEIQLEMSAMADEQRDAYVQFIENWREMLHTTGALTAMPKEMSFRGNLTGAQEMILKKEVERLSMMQEMMLLMETRRALQHRRQQQKHILAATGFSSLRELIREFELHEREAFHKHKQANLLWAEAAELERAADRRLSDAQTALTGGEQQKAKEAKQQAVVDALQSELEGVQWELGAAESQLELLHRRTQSLALPIHELGLKLGLSKEQLHPSTLARLPDSAHPHAHEHTPPALALAPAPVSASSQESPPRYLAQSQSSPIPPAPIAAVPSPVATSASPFPSPSPVYSLSTAASPMDPVLPGSQPGSKSPLPLGGGSSSSSSSSATNDNTIGSHDSNNRHNNHRHPNPNPNTNSSSSINGGRSSNIITSNTPGTDPPNPTNTNPTTTTNHHQNTTTTAPDGASTTTAQDDTTTTAQLSEMLRALEVIGGRTTELTRQFGASTRRRAVQEAARQGARLPLPKSRRQGGRGGSLQGGGGGSMHGGGGGGGVEAIAAAASAARGGGGGGGGYGWEGWGRQGRR